MGKSSRFIALALGGLLLSAGGAYAEVLSFNCEYSNPPPSDGAKPLHTQFNIDVDSGNGVTRTSGDSNEFFGNSTRHNSDIDFFRVAPNEIAFGAKYRRRANESDKEFSVNSDLEVTLNRTTLVFTQTETNYINLKYNRTLVGRCAKAK